MPWKLTATVASSVVAKGTWVQTPSFVPPRSKFLATPLAARVSTLSYPVDRKNQIFQRQCFAGGQYFIRN